MRYRCAMGAPLFAFVFDFILGVFGIILLVGIALAVLVVVVRRRERDKQAESMGLDHRYPEPPPLEDQPHQH